MSVTQFAFMGLAILYPEKFGMRKATDHELEGFIHFWRCIGYLLGIEDRFNFCQLDNLPAVRTITSLFLEDIVKPMMKISLTPEYEHMGRAVAIGAQNYLFSTYESSFIFITWVIEAPASELTKRVSLFNRIRGNFLIFLFSVVGNLPYMNYFINHGVQVILSTIFNPPPAPSFLSIFKPPRPVKGLSKLWNNP